MNDKVKQDLDTLKDLGGFLVQERNGYHLSEADIQRTQDHIDNLQKRLNKLAHKEIANLEVWTAINAAMSNLGLEHVMGGDANGGFEDEYSGRDYSIKIGMKN